MRAVVEVNLKAIDHNIKQIKSLTKSEILAVVKADAYGCLLYTSDAADE